VSLTFRSPSNSDSRASHQIANLSVRLFSILLALLTVGAVAADQFAARSLSSSSPLWATGACLALVWRQGGTAPQQATEGFDLRFFWPRVAAFSVAHAAIVLIARASDGALAPLTSTDTSAGWMIAALKLSVLFPTLLLIPLSQWRALSRVYAAEGIAALVVLFTFLPHRIFVHIWPWYGQILGKFVFAITRLFVPGLTYSGALMPTLHGPDLDVTILFSCSGISGITLFDCLFAFVVFLDWNRLRKGRAVLAYFLGIAVMLLGNALRIASLVIAGNRGFAESVSRFHLSAGWMFFSVVFLAYLAATHRFLFVDPHSLAD